MARQFIIPTVIIAILASATGTAYYYDFGENTNAIAENSQHLEIHFIDVNQGDSTLLITPGDYVILVDGGNNGKGHGVAEYIQNLGIEEIDLIVATHPDADHIGGLDEVIDSIPVLHTMDNGQPHPRHTITYQDHISAIEDIDRTILRQDTLWVVDDDSLLEFIAPYDDGNGLDRDLNANSILLKASFGGKSILLTGDCEKTCEESLLAGDVNPAIGDDLDTDILKVGHHGSLTSTSEEFLEVTSPEIGIISVGNNQWGLPKDAILDRLDDYNVDVYRTDMNGTVVVTIDATGNVLLALSK